MYLRWITLFLWISIGYSASQFPELRNTLKPSTTSSTQEKAVIDLLHRLIPDQAEDFSVQIDPHFNNNKEAFQVIAQNNKVHIVASTGVTAAWGFNHYLKYFCNCHVSWEANQLQLPESWPDANFTITASQSVRYYQNTCTSGYSFVWWNWQTWEQHIDWMALNGINLPLAFTAQEAIWQRVYLSLGLTQDELDKYFTGPAFLAWNRMGNFHGWGGPLPSNWHKQRLAMQHQILERMRSFGMTPVLPAFAGHVPEGVARVFPTANLTKMADWCGFNSTYCCTEFLDPLDPLFQKIGTLFLKELTSEFGTNHIYNCDSFNEVPPPSRDPVYIQKVGSAIFKSMETVDADAIWLMQGWLFMDSNTWREPQAKALLTSVPLGRMLVLDLESELNPIYQKFKSYFGQPFVWCMLHNFGGTLGLYGDFQSVNQGVFTGANYPNSTMIGIGLTPEGINQNYIMYDFMLEMGWRNKEADLNGWVKNYAVRRYGVTSEPMIKAWKLLQDSVYNWKIPAVVSHATKPTHETHSYGKYLMGPSYQYFARNHGFIQPYHGFHLLTRRPGLNLKPVIGYDPSMLYEAWQTMKQEEEKLGKSETYRHDLVDVTREFLQVQVADIYQDLVKAYEEKNITKLSVDGLLLLDTLDSMEKVLSTNEAFMLDPWIKSARFWGSTQEEQRLLEFNARNQITLWGPRGEILDYATKQWSGVVNDYFQPRWKLFIDSLTQAVETNTRFNDRQFNKKVFDLVEEPFTRKEGTLRNPCRDCTLQAVRDASKIIRTP